MKETQSYLLEALQKLEKVEKEHSALPSPEDIDVLRICKFLKELVQEQIENENSRHTTR